VIEKNRTKQMNHGKSLSVLLDLSIANETRKFEDRNRRRRKKPFRDICSRNERGTSFPSYKRPSCQKEKVLKAVELAMDSSPSD
jgi:hypothetical protein